MTTGDDRILTDKNGPGWWEWIQAFSMGGIGIMLMMTGLGDNHTFLVMVLACLCFGRAAELTKGYKS